MKIVESDTEPFKLCVVLTGKQINELVVWLECCKLTGSLYPEHDPTQGLALAILRRVKQQLVDRRGEIPIVEESLD